MSSCGHVTRHDSRSFSLTQRSECFQERAFKSCSNVKIGHCYHLWKRVSYCTLESYRTNSEQWVVFSTEAKDIKLLKPRIMREAILSEETIHMIFWNNTQDENKITWYKRGTSRPLSPNGSCSSPYWAPSRWNVLIKQLSAASCHHLASSS